MSSNDIDCHYLSAFDADGISKKWMNKKNHLRYADGLVPPWGFEPQFWALIHKEMVKRYLTIAQADIESVHRIASPVTCWHLGD